jgi:hypothetical protein
MIQLKSIDRSYKTGAGRTWVLRRVSLDSDPLTLAVATVPVAQSRLYPPAASAPGSEDRSDRGVGLRVRGRRESRWLE